MPPIAWSPVLTGAALSLALTLISTPLIGVAAGGALAGGLSAVARVYQGSLVAVITILAIAVLPFAGPDDTVIILLTDAALLAVGAFSAFVAGRLRR